MYSENFPIRLKKAREDAGYTQQQVADFLNIKRSTLGNYEIGRTEPDIETIATLADFYEISVDWLFSTGKKK